MITLHWELLHFTLQCKQRYSNWLTNIGPVSNTEWDIHKNLLNYLWFWKKFQSWVCPLYKSLCSPQFIQDIAQGTEGIVSKWSTTYDLLKRVDRCIQETGTKLGNVACRINFDNLHHIETYVLEGIRKRFDSEFRLLSFVSGEVHSHHAQWNVILDPIFKIAHHLDLNKIYPISEALTQCLASMESHLLQMLNPNRVPYYSGKLSHIWISKFHLRERKQWNASTTGFISLPSY